MLHATFARPDLTTFTRLDELGLEVVGQQVFGVELSESAIQTVVTSTILPILGKAAAAQLLKLFPGVGSVANAAVAGTLTGAAGLAWVALCEKDFLGEIDLNLIDGSVLNEQFMALLQQRLKEQGSDPT